MSTLQSIGQIRDLRSEILQTNNAIRVLSNIAVEGQLALRDYLTLVRLLTGGNESLSGLITNMQITLAVVQTLRTATKALEVEIGPVGWLLLGIGAIAGLTGYTIYENTRGT